MAFHNDPTGQNTSPTGTTRPLTANRPHAAEPTRKALVTRESRLSTEFVKVMLKSPRKVGQGIKKIVPQVFSEVSGQIARGIW